MAEKTLGPGQTEYAQVQGILGRGRVCLGEESQLGKSQEDWICYGATWEPQQIVQRVELLVGILSLENS